MMSEPAMSQPVPTYFLQEASELIEQIDHELQTLRQDFGVKKMHGLMRAAHTLKGAAASVGLEAIKTTTHSLEDAFKALCAPEAILTATVEGLIFEAYDCLQLLVSAQTSNVSIDESGILDRMADVVTRLQQNLGDQFGQDGYLPTSTELGFDMTQSIFEMGVAQRLNELETALVNPEAKALDTLLRSQADVFFGLAESLNLPGFGAIAHATIMALDQQPVQAVKIATVALADYRAGQASVLQGDRTHGGSPSAALKNFGKQNKTVNKHHRSQTQNLSRKSVPSNWLYRIWDWLNTPVKLSLRGNHNKLKSSSVVKEDVFSQTEEAPYLTDVSRPQPAESPMPESIDNSLEEATAITSYSANPQATAEVPPLLVTPINQPTLEALHDTEIDGAESSQPLNDITFRVSRSHFEQIDHTIGDILTQHNRQSLHHERLSIAMKMLLTHLTQQQQQLCDLQRQTTQTVTTLTPSSPQEPLFDALELDRYSNLQLSVKNCLETIVQQTESAEALELFLRHSRQTLEKQKHLMDELRATVLEARMQPLGNLFQRFDSVLKRLSVQYQKPVHLVIHGEGVLVDKAIADKLYDPLLHLVRNAFDHGIEPADIRQQQGKTEAAKIQLSAHQSGHYLTIQIRDNGQGLNIESIRRKVIENQLISTVEAQGLTPVQISDFIFKPDLSTADQVNDLSGRGVGLDAVRTQVNTLKGTVTVASHPGRGTCFTLKIPANVSIATLLLCQSDKRLYGFIVDTIEQILIPKSGQLTIRDNRKILSYEIKGDTQLIPVIPLAEALTYNTSLPQIAGQSPLSTSEGCPIVLIRAQKRFIGLEIDQLLGEQELVIRSLGDMTTMSAPSYVYGCSALPDGRLSLVVDGAALTLKFWDDLSGNKQTTVMERSIPATLKKSKPLSISKRSILVMDDSITVRNTLSQALQKAGYLVLQAKDGTEGLCKLRQANVAAIFCDLEMPGMNGFEFLKARQRDPKIAVIPTIMLTSRGGIKHQQLARALGATDYLTKPYLTPQLLKSLETVLAKPVSGSTTIK